MPYQFSGFTLDERLFQLRRGTREVPLRPQVFDALSFLVAERDRVVSKAELLSYVWKGSHVSENALSQVIRELRQALGEGDAAGAVRTVHGRGFRFDADVTRTIAAFPAEWAGRPDASLSTPTFATAVLPFEGVSADPLSSEIGAALSENLTRRLARARTVPVLSASSTWGYARAERSLRGVGEELGAAHIVEGRVRRAGGRLRVTVHLGDARHGTEVWAEAFDVAGDDFLALEDDLASAVFGAIHPELVRCVAEAAAPVPDDALEARLLLVRGLRRFHLRTPKDNAAAIEYLARAAPTEAGAAYYLGLAHYNDVYYQWRADPEASLRKAAGAVELCRTIAPGDASGYILGGLLSLFSGDCDGARASAELAVEANPSLPEARALLGRTLAVAGRADDGLDQIRIALQLSPRDPWPGDLVGALAIGHFVAGRYEAAAHHAAHAASLSPNLLSNHLVAAASRALLGDEDGAHGAAARALALSSFSARPFRRLLATSPAELRERFFDGLARAGLPVD